MLTPTPKRKWSNDPKAKPEERQALALEFIAHYLDRIDFHLERLSLSAESGGANAKILTDIKKLLEK